MPLYSDMTNLPSRVEEIINRCQELFTLNALTAPNREKIRDLMNGGVSGVSRLVGRDVLEDHADMVPVSNHILKAVDRMGQKIGKRPDVKVDPPNDEDKEAARKRADKRARILDSFDRAGRVKLQLPQAGRWLPGYGFVPWVVKQRLDANGDPYPSLEMRDPYNAYPGTWTVHQQPRDIAFTHTLPVKELERLFPGTKEKLGRGKGAGVNSVDYLPREGGGVVLGAGQGTVPAGSPSWANQAGSGAQVYEYYDEYGCWWVLPDTNQLLSYVPNLMSSPAFLVAKRYSFDRLQGQYDQLIGLIAASARLNVLMIAAAEDTVNAETNVIGDMVAGKYNRGRRAVNYLSAGSSVERLSDRIPFEAFQQADRIERQIRNMATYPVTDDSVSPNSFVTEVGLERLGGAVEEEYQEYRLLIGQALEDADALRFEWIETYYPDTRLNMEGFREGASFADTYTPRTHISGHRRSRRVYGAMAGFDDANKIVVGSVLQDKGVIDTDTFRENVDGLEDHALIKNRIHGERMQEILYTMMAAGAEQMDPRIINLIIEELPDGPRKELFREMFEQEEEPSPEEMMGMGGPGVPPDVTTTLNRLTTQSDPLAGVQTVGRSE